MEKAGLLKNNKDRPGKPLRDLLRKGQLPHAYQAGGKGSRWIIPISDRGSQGTGDRQNFDEKHTISTTSNSSQNLNEKLRVARERYKPKQIKFLLVAEAPPDSLERFFYYPDVQNHDHLFLGVMQCLFPKQKSSYLKTGRRTTDKVDILEKFKDAGFYLLDLSELPLNYSNDNLHSQLPILINKLDNLITKQTPILLIKANVYDLAFTNLNSTGFSVINKRIPFPSTGNQKRFNESFNQALKLAGYKT